MKNTDGSLGPICNNCGGYGYTLKLGGGTIDCSVCGKTGIGEEVKETPAVEPEVAPEYVFLGIHENQPKTEKGVKVQDDNGQDILEKVVRVRMFVKGKPVDENFTWLPDLTTAERLAPVIKERMSEL